MLESLQKKAEIKTENFAVIESNLIERIRADFLDSIENHQIGTKMLPKMIPMLDLKDLSFRDNPPSERSDLQTFKLLVQWDKLRLTE